MSESMRMSRSSGPLSREARERNQSCELGRDVNVGETERLISLAAGSALLAFGATRRTIGGLGLALLGGTLVYRGFTGQCSGYRSLGISTARSRGFQTSVPAQHGAKVEESVTILRPREELFRYWRDFSNLPRIMRHLKSVQVIDGRRSHWVAEGPLGYQVEWDAEVITERENELIGWRSVGDSAVDTAGSVHFTEAPGGRGTEVQVVLKYDPPAGKLGVAVARMLGQSPSEQIREDLRQLKLTMEAGTPRMSEREPGGSRA